MSSPQLSSSNLEAVSSLFYCHREPPEGARRSLLFRWQRDCFEMLSLAMTIVKKIPNPAWQVQQLFVILNLFQNLSNPVSRHSGIDPESSLHAVWIPACAGMTKTRVFVVKGIFEIRFRNTRKDFWKKGNTNALQNIPAQVFACHDIAEFFVDVGCINRLVRTVSFGGIKGYILK